MKRIFAGIVLSVFLDTTAFADQFEYEGRTFELPVPKGYCAANTDNAFDVNMLKYLRDVQKGQNALVALLYPCENLSMLRNGVPIGTESYALYLFQLNQQTKEILVLPDAVTRTQFVNAVAQTLAPTSVEKMGTKAKEMISDSMIGKQANVNIQSMDIGVLEKTPNALYLALAINLEAQGKKTAMAAVSCLTKYNTNSMTYNVYDKYVNDETYERLLVKCKDVMQTAIGKQ